MKKQICVIEAKIKQKKKKNEPSSLEIVLGYKIYPDGVVYISYYL